MFERLMARVARKAERRAKLAQDRIAEALEAEGGDRRSALAWVMMGLKR